MRRRLFNIVTAASLLLCVAAAMLWVGTHQKPGMAMYKSQTDGPGSHLVRCVWAYRGFVHYEVERGEYPALRDRPVLAVERSTKIKRSLRRHYHGSLFPGFRSWRHAVAQDAGTPSESRRTYHMITAPLWFATSLFALLPLWAAVRRRVIKPPRRPGFCTTCGYDLHATPEQCPECGTRVEAEPRSAA